LLNTSYAMANFQRTNSRFTQTFYVTTAIIFSGLCWYFSNGLNGDFWYLLWIAPVPLMIISFNNTARMTFFVSFTAYLTGRLSWFTYLVTVATLIPAVIFTLLLPLIFAVIMTITRGSFLKTKKWYAVFAFPVFFTVFEYLVMKFSPDGTAASIAYSQMDFLPVIQLASVTGILGITFIVTFFPSALAVGWYFRREKRKVIPLAITSFVLLFSVLLFGFYRISNSSGKKTTTVGLAVLDEKLHKMGTNLDIRNELLHTRNYAKEITNLAARGAKLVVLPERAININSGTDSATVSVLRSTAIQNRVALVAGYTNFKNSNERNSALVINAEGVVVKDYNKVHLVKGLENQFTPGSEIGLFNIEGIQAGIAICKDLDFPGYIKKYGAAEVTLVCIPAWDFVTDDWLHSRMALLRGVENGFSEVRTARLGRLTISDYYGRVIAEADCSDGLAKSLIGDIPLERSNTFYNRFGDWFGIVNIIAAIGFIFIPALNRGKDF